MIETAISSLETARGKFFMKFDAHHVWKVGIKTFLGLGGQAESYSQ